MKGFIATALVLICIQYAPTASADPYDICLPAVEQAVTTHYRVQSNSGRTAVRDALTQTRSQTGSDTSSGGGQIGVDLVDVIGVNLGGSSSSSKTSQLAEKYKRDSSLALSNEDYVYTLTTVENPAVADLAKECIRSVGLGQGAFRYTVNDVQSDDFSITYHYVPQASSDPVFLTVTNLTVNGGAAIDQPSTLGAGTRIDAYAGYTQRFRRTREDESALVQLDLKERPTVPVTIAAKKKFDPLPVGMVIASPLPWGQFAQLAADSSSFDAKKNKWAPCDGRSVAGSALATGGIGQAPDLRGVFIRGLNDFAAGSVAPVASTQADPDSGRRAMDFQADAIGAHDHDMGYGRHGLANGKGLANLELRNDRPSARTRNAGGAETRPKNVALYYYVKIN